VTSVSLHTHTHTHTPTPTHTPARTRTHPKNMFRSVYLIIAVDMSCQYNCSYKWMCKCIMNQYMHVFLIAVVCLFMYFCVCVCVWLCVCVWCTLCVCVSQLRLASVPW